MRKTLRETFEEHTGKISDRWTLYLEEWDRLFGYYRDQQIHLLEIGIQNGGSLEIWAKYFLKAEKIVGCDIDEKCRQLKYGDDRIAVVVCDANSDECENEILRQAPTFDIIIDDGSHRSSDIIRTFARYFPHLNDNGIYVVEDLHCSYWKDFEGGLHNPFSAMSFIKRLADILNYEHWRNKKSRANLLTAFTKNLGIEFEERQLNKIHSIEFINSLCIIKKLPNDRNDLGKRIVVGSDEIVTDEWKQFNGTLIHDFEEVITDDANLDVFELIETTNTLVFTIRERDQTVQTLTTQVTERDQTVQTLTTQVTERDQTVQTLTAQVTERDQTVQTLIAQVAERDQSVQTLTDKVAERDQSVHTLTAQVAYRDQSVHTLTAQVAYRDQTIRSLTKQTIQREQEKQTLKTQLSQSQEEVLFYALSKSWRITRPLRKFTRFIKWGKNA